MRALIAGCFVAVLGGLFAFGNLDLETRQRAGAAVQALLAAYWLPWVLALLFFVLWRVEQKQRKHMEWVAEFWVREAGRPDLVEPKLKPKRSVPRQRTARQSR
jgi:hypothetical protein